MTAWVPTVRNVSDGENVDENVTNRAITDLTNRTQHLKEIVDQIEAGELLVIRDATILTGLAIGDWVYYESGAMQYQKAIAELISTTGGLVTGPRSYVAGVIVALNSPTNAVIATGGFVRDSGGAIFGALVVGDWFLSDTTPGTIDATPSVVPIFTGVKNSNDTFHINIDTKDLLNSGDAVYTLAVTSVATANDNINVTGCEDGGGSPAQTAPRTKDIIITLPDTIVTDDAADGALVVKETDGVKLKRGLVVEKILPGAGISITSSDEDTPGEHKGTLTITASDTSIRSEIQVVALDNAREETIRGVLHHSFPSDIDSSIRLKVAIPGAPGGPALALSLRFWVMGTTAGALPDLGASYHELLAPDGSIVGPISNTETALPNQSLQTIDTALKYFDLVIPDITVPAGSIIHISLSRDGAADAYVGDVGLLSMSAVIS